MKRRKKRAETDFGGLRSSWAFWLAGLCALLILARFIAGFFPHLRLWGINHLAYFPLYARIIVLFMSFSVFLPAVNRGIRAIARWCLLSFSERASGGKRLLWYVTSSLLAMILFWVLRSRTYLLGDGFNYVSNLHSGLETRIWSELLESFIHVRLHDLMGLFLLPDGHLTYQLASLLAGGFFILLAFLFSDYLGRSLFQKTLVFSLLATMGSVQLFFGYVEHYSFVFVTVLAYVLSSLRWLDKGGSIVLPASLFLLAIAFHFSAFMFLPSLIYLFLLTGRSRITARKLLVVGGGAALALALVSIYVYASKPLLVRIFVLPFEGQFTAAGYTSFSPAHLLDILNELVLISPAGMIVISATFLGGCRHTDLKDPRRLFLILVAGFGFIYHFTFDPLLGAVRDWDMFAITSGGYTLLGICLLLRARPESETQKYAYVILVWTALFSLVPWVALNANETKSVHRFRDALELDPAKSKSGRFFLMHYLDQKGEIEEVKKEDMRQMEIYPAQYMALQAREYYDRGMPDSALDIIRKAVELDSFSSDIRYHFGKIHYLRGKLDSAEVQYRQALRLKPENVGAYIDLAQIYILQHRWEEALDQYNMVIKFGIEDPLVYDNMGNIHLSRDRPSEAVKYLRKAVKLRGDLVLTRCRLAIALSKTGRVDQAIKEFEKVIELNPDLDHVYLHLGYLYRDTGQAKKAEASWEQFLTLSTNLQESEVIRNELDSLRNR